MSLKRNIVANYIGQVYVISIGLVMVPILIRYLGPEGFGLVAFFINLQAWFQLLDLGLTPTMARETARYTGGAIDAGQLRRLLRAMEQAFVALALLGSLALLLGAGPIARHWLNAEELPVVQVEQAIILMAFIVACRWIGGLYRGVISGLECLVWLNTFNMLMATARFVLVIPVLIYLGAGPTQFFGYQLGLALLELMILFTQAYRLIGTAALAGGTYSSWKELRRLLDFSLSVALASVVWLMASQVDKLLLAKLLTLTEYGYFSVAAVIAGGVMLVAGPVSGAVLPRMTAMEAAGDGPGMIRLYRDATQLVTVVAVPLTLVLAVFPEQVLWAWAGDERLMANAAPVLSLYALGSGVLVLGAFPYYLQHAKGALRLHVAGSLLFVLVLIPALPWAIGRYGMIGAGWVWLLTNSASFLLWVPFVHSRFAPGLHLKWLGRDILLIIVLPVLCAGLLLAAVPWPFGRLGTLIQLCLIGVLLTACAVVGSATLRAVAIRRIRGVLSHVR